MHYKKTWPPRPPGLISIRVGHPPAHCLRPKPLNGRRIDQAATARHLTWPKCEQFMNMSRKLLFECPSAMAPSPKHAGKVSTLEVMQQWATQSVHLENRPRDSKHLCDTAWLKYEQFRNASRRPLFERPSAMAPSPKHAGKVPTPEVMQQWATQRVHLEKRLRHSKRLRNSLWARIRLA